ncbi:erythromycin esterase family protein [Streptomyces sp. NPDC049555]|uniref:erythromycin esterase family protein n=1 Tax=Streptomyces sp. NPDC049555 TaxID=3154930 RepID=UPI003432D789
MTHMTLRRAAVLTVALASLLGPAIPAATAVSPVAPAAARAGQGPDRGVVAGLERSAHPLRSTAPGGSDADLAAFGAATRGARIVGLGEASHGSKEIFTVKDRLLRRLVTHEGFSAFAMEISWSAGVRLDTYVRTGEGDLSGIMREEFQDGYGLLNTEELRQLFAGVREHNRTAARPVRIVGLDFSDADPEQYERILAWAGKHTPALVPELDRRYAALRALPGGVGARLAAYSALPLAERTAMADDARAAYRLLEEAAERDAWVLQEARILAQMAESFAVDFDDPAQVAAANRQRDRIMAETAVWWQRTMGDRLVLSAHDGHVSYDSAFPGVYPVTMGADLRELIGSGYLAVGTTVYSGDYRARTASGEVGTFSVPPAAPGSNEETLDAVRHRDFVVDLRAARRDPAVAAWLGTARPTYVIPGRHPYNPVSSLALGSAYDVVVHLHQVHASVPVPVPGQR